MEVAVQICIVAIDTRGGVQPYAALAGGLQRAGHQVRIAAPEDFTDWLTRLGLDAVPLTGRMEDAARAAAEAGFSGGVVPKGMREQMIQQSLRHARELLGYAENSDVLMGGVGGAVLGVDIAERLGVPFVHAHLQPVGTVSTALPGVLTPWMPAWTGGVGNLIGSAITESALTLPFRAVSHAVRTQVLGLPRRRSRPREAPLSLYGFSRHVVSVPANWNVTGYWFLPEDPAWTPQTELVKFLDAGEAPVCIGFGSMVGADPAATARLVTEAVRRAGVRAVLLTGWGGMSDIATSENVIVMDQVPHSWLFARAAAVVHHGGAGTTAAALRAGVPSVVVPHGVDQPFWAKRVAALGVGPRPLSRAALSVDSLATALHTAFTDERLRTRAAHLGERIRAEDGITAAADVLTRGLSRMTLK
ncbi:glycosyltransferase [Lentzea sp. NEAU-D7]|uniref:glycosyltransferase n=1 Tax=Lentzea sp. NEAU-D7 TaxID=2994667 RepID=UPI00224A9CCC|nr:glycosyltransferase [Lentzea sp. NEAU-D7]MCX2951401.1 glycosyltransferase [Lentzea sp. NEAU-D7]